MTKDKRLSLVLLLNLSMVLALVVVGLSAHSLGVLAAAGDYTGDAAGVALGLLALRLSRRNPRYARAMTFAALANASFLLAVTAVVMFEGVHRLTTHPPGVHGLAVIIISAVAGAVMAACAFIIGRVESGDLNMRAVMLDTLADGLSAAGVAVSGAVILASKGTFWLDPAVALAIALIVAYHAIKLIRDVLHSLQSAPEGASASRRA